MSLARLVCLFLVAVALSAESPRPNILLILADDLGYSDLGCYGGEIRTPNLDRLAENGLRFTSFYNASRCCPTRASLMTGVYPHQAGVGRMTFDQGLPGYRGTLRQDVVTIAEVLRTAGYRTAMVGKWHLSPTKNTPQNTLWVSHRLNLGRFSEPRTYPTARGFEEFWGTIWGVVDYFDPFSLVHDDEPVEEISEGFYYTDAINDRARDFIRKYGAADEPFFLYVAHTAPHWPLHALADDIARYEGVYDAGWDALRERRYRRMLEIGLFGRETTPLSPRHPGDLAWKDNPHHAWDARAMAVHAAMVDRLDQGLGRVFEELERLGELERTLILFLSDNGASPELPQNFKPGFDRPSTPATAARSAISPRKKWRPGRRSLMPASGRCGRTP